VSELEGELLDERRKQQVKYDYSLDILKSSMNGQVMDYKIQFEEKIMKFKEDVHKLKIEN
jgi:hypothetical protein